MHVLRFGSQALNNAGVEEVKLMYVAAMEKIELLQQQLSSASASSSDGVRPMLTRSNAMNNVTGLKKATCIPVNYFIYGTIYVLLMSSIVLTNLILKYVL